MRVASPCAALVDAVPSVPCAARDSVRHAAAACGPSWYTGRVDAVLTIVGAGPAGLGLARELQRLGMRPTLLERGSVGETWARHYRGLRLHTLAMSARLPGMAWPTPRPRFPSGAEFLAYLRAYASAFDLDVREMTRVLSVERRPAERPDSPTSWAASDALASEAMRVNTTNPDRSFTLGRRPSAKRDGGQMLPTKGAR